MPDIKLPHRKEGELATNYIIRAIKKQNIKGIKYHDSSSTYRGGRKAIGFSTNSQELFYTNLVLNTKKQIMSIETINDLLIDTSKTAKETFNIPYRMYFTLNSNKFSGVFQQNGYEMNGRYVIKEFHKFEDLKEYSIEEIIITTLNSLKKEA